MNGHGSRRSKAGRLTSPGVFNPGNRSITLYPLKGRSPSGQARLEDNCRWVSGTTSHAWKEASMELYSRHYPHQNIKLSSNVHGRVRRDALPTCKSPVDSKAAISSTGSVWEGHLFFRRRRMCRSLFRRRSKSRDGILKCATPLALK